MFKLTRLLSFSMLMFISFSPEIIAETSSLPNSSFEQSSEGKPEIWKTHTWDGEGDFHYSKTAHSGDHSAMISSETGGDLSWYVHVAVKPFSSYRFSGWIKTENLTASTGEGALFNLHNIQGAKTQALTGTTDWIKVEMTFDTQDNDSVQLNCLFGGWGLATGKAWYDNLNLQRLTTKTIKPSITINAGKTKAAISDYIYGQFIEHLGRCIYGGIWAEMLEDRKFYYAVGAKESPWEKIGGYDDVEMMTEDSYVGEQTPLIHPSRNTVTRGIAQAGLGLERSHEYVGRIVLAGDTTAAAVEVSLIWGQGSYGRQTIVINDITSDYVKIPMRFIAGNDTNNGRLEIVAKGAGALRIGTVSLMPGDNIHGMRADTLKLLKELDAPIYRWPGGNFVSGYDWKDGIGDRDKRPPRKNPAWKGVEHNDFGLNEFIMFCREVNAEPLIVVNSGLGGVESAVEELEYANGDLSTPMGRWRAETGNTEPYDVQWWGIGNEMYGGWQLGHMPLEDYVKKHNRFAEAMRAADPSIKLVAVGAVGEWSRTMLAECAVHMDLISEHFYCGEQKGLLSHVNQIPNNVERIANAHREYRRTISSLEDKDIQIALDEWNYWYGPHLYGELGVRYHLKDALGIAAGLNALVRNSDVYHMANYAQTVNVIGCIKTSKTDATFATTGLPLKLYRHHFGKTPVAIYGDPEPLDVAAAWNDERTCLTVAVVNPLRENLQLELKLKGISLTGSGWLYQINGPDAMAYNEPGEGLQVVMEKTEVNGITNSLELTGVSVSLFVLEVE